jgi:hypothetical protein
MDFLMLIDLLLFASVLAVSGIVFAPLHVVFARASGGKNIMGTVNAAIGISAIVGAVLVWLVMGPVFSSDGAKAVACVGGAISFAGYAALYNLLGPTSVDRSISAHILNIIYQAPAHTMTKEELFSVYTHSDVLEKRLAECAEIGMIVRQGQQITLTASGRRMGQFYAVLGKVLSMQFWHLERYRAR